MTDQAMMISKARRIVFGLLLGLCDFTQLSSAEQSLRSSNKPFVPIEISRLPHKGDSISHLHPNNGMNEKEDLSFVMTKRYNQAVLSNKSKIGGDIERENCGDVVDISEDGKYLLVGCPLSNNRRGSAYLYELTSNKWQEKRIGSGQSINEFYGSSVSLARNNNNIITAIGAHGYNVNQGVVQVITQPNDKQELFGSPIKPTSFGYSVDLSKNGKKIAVGVLGEKGDIPYVRILSYNGNWKNKRKIPLNTEDGLIDVNISDDGEKVAVAHTIFDSEKSPNDEVILALTETKVRRFEEGREVSLSGNGKVIVIGYPLDNCDNNENFSKCGRVKVFDATVDEKGKIGRKIVGSDPGGQCGKSLGSSSDGRRVVIGCNNKVIVATLNNQNQWDTTSIDSINLISVAISSDGTKIAIGSRADSQANGIGLVQVFEFSSLTPAPVPSSTTSAPVPTKPTTPKPPATPKPPSSYTKGKGKKKKSKGKDKGSKGKGKKKYSCLVDDIYDALFDSSFNIATYDFNLKTSGNPTLDDLNQAACDNDLVRLRYLSRTMQEKPTILAVAVTSLKEKENNCNTECRYDVKANIFYTGNDDLEDDRVGEYLVKKFRGSVSKLQLLPENDSDSRGSSSTSSSASAGQESQSNQESQEYTLDEGSSSVLLPMVVSLCAIALIGVGTVFFIQNRNRNRATLSPVRSRQSLRSRHDFNEIRPRSNFQYEKLGNAEFTVVAHEVEDDRVSFPIDILNVEENYIDNLPSWTAFDD